MQRKTINLALSKSKYFSRISSNIDGYIFDYVDDITEVKTMQTIAMLSIERNLERNHMLPERKWYSIFQAKEDRYKGIHINLYNTGFTSMLLSVLNVCYAYGISVTCYHWDRKNQEFFPQEVYVAWTIKRF